MPFKDPQIAAGPALPARVCQAVFPLIRCLQYSSSDVQSITKPIARPGQITVPTRHGAVRTQSYSPTAQGVGAQLATGHRPRAYLITHGGADHGFPHPRPSEVARAASTMTGDLLGKAKDGPGQNRK